MTRRVLLTAIVLFVWLNTPASADVGVSPGTDQPSVILDGSRESKPSQGRDQSSGRANTGRPERELTYCEIQQRDFGLLCAELDPLALPVAPAPAAETPEPTDGDVLRAVREIGLPSLSIQVQPAAATLVNVDTIFHTQPEEFARSVTLLGFAVDVEAEAISFEWHHGDGTSATTTKPGRPYPAMDVTHTYLQPAKGLRPRVDVTYRVRYRVDGGPWTLLADTLTAQGTLADLEVKEAAPVLTTR